MDLFSRFAQRTQVESGSAAHRESWVRNSAVLSSCGGVSGMSCRAADALSWPEKDVHSNIAAG
eukprot:473057-Rhodomonas_salina.4